MTKSASAKPGVEIADLEFEALGDVRRLGRRRLDPARDHVLEQQRRVGRHRLVDIDDVRQHLVVDLDQRRRLFGDGLAGRGDGGDRVAFVERLFARHHVARDMPEILRHPLRADVFELVVGEIGAVMTALTPGSATAFEVSIERMRACACGERTILP